MYSLTRMREREQDSWQTLSYEEGLPLIDDMFKLKMEVCKQWADEMGKVIVFRFNKDGEPFYNYRDKINLSTPTK